MMRENPYLLLLDALKFSTEELELNRRGQLSRQQRNQLKHRFVWTIRRWLLALVALIPAGVLLHVRWMILVFSGATVVSVMVSIWLRWREDLKSRVSTADGYLNIMPQMRLPFAMAYQLSVDNVRFTVSRRTRAAFAPGRRYRVYYAPGSRTILSAELSA
ncbi:MAG: hypothetical protein JNJ61_28645 [Anaerolineae bacterium]|nr:hypothetical protein [Anaerolineae bacterium]